MNIPPSRRNNDDILNIRNLTLARPRTRLVKSRLWIFLVAKSHRSVINLKTLTGSKNWTDRKGILILALRTGGAGKQAVADVPILITSKGGSRYFPFRSSISVLPTFKVKRQTRGTELNQILCKGGLDQPIIATAVRLAQAGSQRRHVKSCHTSISEIRDIFDIKVKIRGA